MIKSKACKVVICILAIIIVLYSVSVHQKLFNYTQNNLLNSAELIHGIHHYLGQIKLLEQPKDAQTANINFINKGLIIFRRYMGSIIQPYDEKLAGFLNEQTTGIYQTLLDAIENPSEEKYEQIKSSILTLYAHVDKVYVTLRDNKLVRVPILGEYLIKKQVHEMIDYINGK